MRFQAQTERKMTPKYRRILLKLSGEVLLNKATSQCIDPAVVTMMSDKIKAVKDAGVDVAVVLGGGNIFRGAIGEELGIGRSAGDYMGMLATVINAIALQNALERDGVPTRVQTAIAMHEVAEPYLHRKALSHLEKGRVVIFAAGTGNPYFSTDTAAALRASEIGADVLLKATKVDGVYTSDPVKDPTAVRYDRLTYKEALTKSIRVMDSSAFALCMENKIPIIVFNFFERDSLMKAIAGEQVGTTITEK